MKLRGFTLIELMIVVAIIAIIAAIAIPSLVNSRKSANESRAVGTMRSIITVQEQYRTRFGSYASSLDALESSGYIDVAFDAYSPLSYAATRSTWHLSAGPTTPSDGDRYFRADQTGVIRFSSTGVATATSAPIE